MANKMYGLGAEKTLNKLIDWDTDDIRVVAVDSTYTPNLATHEFVSDLGASVMGTPVALTTKSITGGVFDADDINYVLPAGVCKALIVYKYNASDSAAALLAYIDNIIGFPLTTAGGTVPILWSNGASKIISFLG